MLYSRFPKKLVPSIAINAGRAISGGTKARGSVGMPKRTPPRMIAGPTPIRFAIRPEVTAPRMPPMDEHREGSAERVDHGARNRRACGVGQCIARFELAVRVDELLASDESGEVGLVRDIKENGQHADEEGENVQV